jgi:hypothetical protein
VTWSQWTSLVRPKRARSTFDNNSRFDLLVAFYCATCRQRRRPARRRSLFTIVLQIASTFVVAATVVVLIRRVPYLRHIVG